MPLMLKREYDALVAANGDTPKKPAGEPERAPVVSKEEVENIDNNSADATDDHIVSARLVGSKRHKEARARLKHGTSLHLRRDEANKHDPNAIAVDVTAGFLPIHAGFVKGTQAESLAPALDSGALTVVACTVDAPNGFDSLPTADVPVRLTLRRRDRPLQPLVPVPRHARPVRPVHHRVPPFTPAAQLSLEPHGVRDTQQTP